MTFRRPDRDPTRPVYVISVAASIVSVHPRTLRIYEEEGLVCPARTPTNIRLYSEQDVRRIMPRFKGDGSGDLYVRVRVVLPTDLDDKAAAAARKFLDAVDQPDPRT